MKDLDELVVDRLSSVMNDYFRGFYHGAFTKAEDLAKRSEELESEHLGGYQAQLYAALALFMRPSAGREAERAEGEALALADRAEADVELTKREQLFFVFLGKMLAGWVLTSRRGRQRLNQAIHHLDDAAGVYAKASKDEGYLIPGAWMTFHFKGWAHYHLGEVERAIQDLNRGVLLVNDYVAERQRLDLLRPDASAARSYIRAEMPALSRLLGTRAILFYELGDFPAALEDIDVAIEIDSDNPYVHGLAGVIHFAVSGAKTQTSLYGVGDHHASALRHLLKARELSAGQQDSSGRSEHYLNLFSYQYRADSATEGSLSAEARTELARVPDNQSLTEDVFERFLKTRRILEAVSCLLVGLDPLAPPAEASAEGKFGSRMMFQVLCTIEGLYDYLGSLGISDVRFLSLLTKDVEQVDYKVGTDTA